MKSKQLELSILTNVYNQSQPLMDALLQRLEKSLLKMGDIDNESLNNPIAKKKVNVFYN